jgi:FkbM family methyltransferase
MTATDQVTPRAMYDAARARHGSNFPFQYHDYSEGLFLDASAWLRSGDVAIDAGCYLAANALRMAQHVGEDGIVLTFEPDPRMRAQSEAIIAADAHGGRVRLSSVALSDQPGKTEFVIVDELPGHSGLRLKEPKRYGRPVTTWTIPIEVMPLDEVLALQDIDPRRVRLIKFDLEGGELHALAGAADAVRRGRPLVMYEHGNLETYGHKSQDFIDYFTELGYCIIDAYGFEMVTKADLELSSLNGWNMFAAPNPEAAAFVRQLIAQRRGIFVTAGH